MELLRQLKERKLETVLLDGNENCLARNIADKFYKVNIFNIEDVKKIAIDEKVDFIITHCTASSTAALLSHGLYKPDKLTEYLETIRYGIDYKYWFFGHYHDNKNVTSKDICLYDQIVRIA